MKLFLGLSIIFILIIFRAYVLYGKKVKNTRKGRYTWQYLFFLRVPILVGSSLIIFPIAICLNNNKVFQNWFELDFIGLSLTTSFSILLSWIVMHMGLILYEYTPGRTCMPWLRESKAAFEKGDCKDEDHVNEYPKWAKESQYRLPLFSIPAVPLIVVSIINSHLSLLAGIGSIIVGITFAFGIPIVSRRIRQWIDSDKPSHEQKLNEGGYSKLKQLSRATQQITHKTDLMITSKAESFVGKTSRDAMEAGYTWKNALVFLLAVFVAYLIGFFFLDPRSPIQDYVPAIVYVLVLLMLMVIFLSLMTLWLDKFRIPLLSTLMMLGIWGHLNPAMDHFYPIQQKQNTEAISFGSEDVDSNESEWVRAFNARNELRNGDKTPIIAIITASGGGITAARWSTEVLTNLTSAFEADLGDDFLHSIVAVSGVSGGAVGMMNFVKAFDRNETPNVDILKTMVENTSRSSLGAVGWGLVYYDLWRTFIPLPFFGINDRGLALETRWSESSDLKDDNFTAWRLSTLEGKLPVALVSATVVESGTRIIASPLKNQEMVENEGTCRSVDSFGKLHPRHDLRIVTAARLSATFPYVTPISRADIESPNPVCHIADGGYYDNYGVLTALQYLKEIQPSLKEKKIKVVLIQIRASNPNTEKKPNETPGVFSFFTGPIEALMNVRRPSQIERNDRFTLAEQQQWGEGLDTVKFTLEKPSPLSWHLSDTDKKEISVGWCSDENMKQLQTLRRLYGLTDKTIDEIRLAFRVCKSRGKQY